MTTTLHRLRRALAFVESHLAEPFELDDVAEAVGLSRYHLHRIFSATLGDTLKAYVRKRRLTVAARSLRQTERGVLQVALEAGYQSQEAFTRAFRLYFGHPPGRYRTMPAGRAWPGLHPIDLAALPDPDAAPRAEPSVTWLPTPLCVQGLAVGIDFESAAPILAVWREVVPRIERSDAVLHGITLADHPSLERTPHQSLVYVAGVCPDMPPVPGHRIVDVDVPSGQYAVFAHRGPLHSLGTTVNHAWASWLPRSGWAKSDRPDMERICVDALDAAVPSAEFWLSIDPIPSSPSPPRS